MDWATWEPLYTAILDDFGFDRRADEEARDAFRPRAAELIDRKARDAFRERVKDREVWIVGPTASREDLRAIPHGVPVLVTDAAAVVALPLVKPDAIVTDLDGDVELQLAANEAGIPLFLHLHGDNRESVERVSSRLSGPVFATTQAGPQPPVFNHGGFTDGDRAACIAEAFGASSIVLTGFDYENPVFKAGKDVATKKRKLAWAKRIIESLPVPVSYSGTSASSQPK